MDFFRNILSNLKYLVSHRLNREILNTWKKCIIMQSTIHDTCRMDECVRVSDSIIGADTFLAHHSDIWNCTIGNRTSIGRYSILRFADIGKYCAISWNVTIGADGHPIDRISGSGPFYLKEFGLIKEDYTKGIFPRTFIGNDVWIACGVIIRAGVQIGDGAVIGAGSVVTKDVPPYAIVVGTPAKILRYRFDEETIALLRQSEWWNYNDEFIKENIDAFQQPVYPQLLKILTKKYHNQK